MNLENTERHLDAEFCRTFKRLCVEMIYEKIAEIILDSFKTCALEAKVEQCCNNLSDVK